MRAEPWIEFHKIYRETPVAEPCVEPTLDYTEYNH